ncbi:MAG: hypothetical protein EB070_09145 [Synechococcaceae bacterium WBA_2_066]|nr:hypothetical protein [Synechococcaceae bacterium WB6_1A_059]NBP32545.1 hypothetical protein [Synechococcaceae bacterium WB6_1B_055]NBQ19008.1 hypothetical protein [Synechococcaceae bacterium WB5_2A_257]NBY60119.1 hypothetical protein [Synechococcaceae bacterium LLD_019]NDA75347.1 hypothetical protein [Synechococcaceae bacterium WB8_3_299]NDC07440.1 hypothetical protein [Synechococcaceae bacterium WB9_2_069]NDD21403.1 hypothetical protein [Synechococcaceae bacterium WBA_3_309]NDE22343.1 hy
MRQHPIPPVNEPLQFRAIGIVRGTYCPTKTDVLTRGNLTTVDGSAIDAVLLGRVLSLVKRHLNLEQEHLWVVYPRSRDDQKLHLQVVGVWEPSTLASDEEDLADSLPEGDGFFSVRGELIYTKPETGDLVIKIRQLPRADGSRPQPFKLQLKGNIPLEHLRHFLDLRVRLQGELLQIEHWEVIAPMPQRSDRRGGAKKRPRR